MKTGPSGTEASQVGQWAGLGRRSPWVAVAFTFLMLAFTGIPLTSGFTGKFAVFSAAVSQGWAWLAVVGVLASAASPGLTACSCSAENTSVTVRSLPASAEATTGH